MRPQPLPFRQHDRNSQRYLMPVAKAIEIRSFIMLIAYSKVPRGIAPGRSGLS